MVNIEERNYSLYWIHLKEHDLFSGGYAGISKDVSLRWKQHCKSKDNPKLKNAISKYKDSTIFEVIADGLTETEAKAYELLLRPTENIGWNIAAGGGLPPDATGRKHKPESIKKFSGELNGRYGVTGEDHPNFGKKDTTSTLIKKQKARSDWLNDKDANYYKWLNTTKETNSIKLKTLWLNIESGAVRSAASWRASKCFNSVKYLLVEI